MNGEIKAQSVAKNFSYQIFYQIATLVIPLIVSPYLTRTLGDTSLGIYSYTNSIAYYFLAFANLGIAKYGQRCLAAVRDSRDKLRIEFWSLYTVHGVISLSSTLLFFAFAFFFVRNNRTVFLAQSLYVISAISDITWLFYALENFKSIIIRNIIIRVSECVCIFLFIKKPSDLLLYTLIVGLGVNFGQLIIFPKAIKAVPFAKFSFSDAVKHIKPMLVLFISVLAVSLYTVFDKTLLGWLSTKESVAYYTYSDKIISIPRTLIVTIGTVLFPRACKMAAENNLAGQKKYIQVATDVVCTIGCGTVFGLLALADEFSIIYFGPQFAQCGPIMKILSPIVLIIGLGDIIRTQYLIPQKKDKEYTICIVMNAIVNIIVSASLIPLIGVYGAVIGTLSAESFGLIYQSYLGRNAIRIKSWFLSLLPTGVCGCVMFIALIILKRFFAISVLSLCLEVMVGVSIYFGLISVYVYLFRKNYWGLIISKMTSIGRRARK